jgi:hypothetical protein
VKALTTVQTKPDLSSGRLQVPRKEAAKVMIATIVRRVWNDMGIFFCENMNLQQ